MDQEGRKEVYFDQYCPLCEHEAKEEWENPCYYCMSEFTNQNSHKPVYYKEKGKKK